jgi:hypothetical protein
MEFIIAQTILERQEQEGNTINNHWGNIIRKVNAKDKESAIGKFIMQTANIKAKEKLQLECIELDKLTTIS